MLAPSRSFRPWRTTLVEGRLTLVSDLTGPWMSVGEVDRLRVSLRIEGELTSASRFFIEEGVDPPDDNSETVYNLRPTDIPLVVDPENAIRHYGLLEFPVTGSFARFRTDGAVGAQGTYAIRGI